MTLFGTTICAAILALASPALGQEVTTTYTLSDAQMTDRFILDEFRVARMQELISDLPDELIREQLRKHMSDRTKTVLHYDDRFVFAEYSTADGRIYSWMPDSDSVVEGTWRISDEPNTGLSVCFQAGDAPPECVQAAYILSEYCSLAIEDADTFGLSTSEVPFTRQRLAVPGIAKQ